MLIALVALVIRLRPQLSAATRCLLWWLVGLQLIVGLAWQVPVELQWLSAPTAPAAQLVVAPDHAVPLAAQGGYAPVGTATQQAAEVVGRAPWQAAWTHAVSHWRTLLAALWLAGLALR